MKCAHFHLCYYFYFYFSYDIFRYITDMFVLCCWLFEALQRVYGRSELLGLSIYIGTETEVSVANLAVNVASQLFDLILHIWAYLQHVWFFLLWTIEFIRRQQGTAHVLLYFISCITMYSTGQTNIIHVSLYHHAGNKVCKHYLNIRSMYHQMTPPAQGKK